MKKLTAAIFACGVLASSLLSSSASPTMRYSIDGGTTWTNVADDGVLDQVSGLGFLSYTGTAGVWSLNTLVAFGSPILGAPNAPLMDIGTTVNSSAGGTLIVQLSDTNFVGAPNQTFIGQSGGFAGGTATYTAYRDFGNVLFGTTSTYSGDPAGVSPSATASVLYNVGPVTGNYQNSNSVVANGSTPYSVTLQIVIVHNSAIDSHTDSSIWALSPPPCNCALTFNAPAAITNCADDAIPDVTATQDCGSGPVSVPVTLTSISTNGSCPKIITRNYSATDSCGNVQSFTQTVTVNCKPDCTIATVTSATAGVIGYHASVADAGPGATYLWTVANATITGGQGTTNITWTAGTDTTKTITICVRVTTGAGCVSQCCSYVKLNCLANICGHIFADCDGNGDLTAGDVGISNIVISLLDSSNHFLGKTISDAKGGYCFTNLVNGNYIVTITQPSGYCQTAASTSYHWRDTYGRVCWQENDGYTHCINSGTECWWDKSNTCHWKDSYNRDCWKDSWGIVRCQPLSYKSCNAQTNNNCISVSLTNCTSQSDVDFAYTGTKPSISVTCSGPSYVKCGQTYTYTCTVVNTGNVCYKGGNICTTVGNCNYWGGWNYGCNNYTGNCPPLSPGQKCTFTVKCTFNSWNCGTVTCQSTANCNHNFGSSYGQSTCYSQCGW
jgi:hypothetical protein